MSKQRYSVGVVRKAPIGPGEPYAELLAGARDPISVKSIVVSTSSNVGSDIAIVRSHAIGTGAATGIYTAIAHKLGATSPTGPGRVQVAWTSSGVTPTGYISRIVDEVMPIATGATRVIWDETRNGELLIEPGKSLLLINQGSGINAGGLRINFTWEEGRL